jgi:hypothetical protein
MGRLADDDWFNLDEFRSDAERDFVRAISLHATWWGALGLSPEGARIVPAEGKLILFVDVGAPQLVLRTLRIEFDGSSVVMGDDEAGQEGPHLDLSKRKVVTVRSSDLDAGVGLFAPYRDVGSVPARLAERAAEWVEYQTRRRVECHEWKKPSFTHRRWISTDTGEVLRWSDSSNIWRSDLGVPDEVVIVRKFPREGARG